MTDDYLNRNLLIQAHKYRYSLPEQQFFLTFALFC